MFTSNIPSALRTAACATALSLSLAVPLTAETITGKQSQFVEDAGGSQRINFSGKLRMLSQRIPAAACNLNAGVDPDGSRAILEAAMAEFDSILYALEFGDVNLGIYGAEERRRTLRVIEEVHAKMDPLEDALKAIGDGVPSDESIQSLADGNMEVLEMAKLLVDEITGEYANPVALSQSDAITIDIAGRQRMLTQMVSKDVCLAMSGVNATSSRTSLPKTMAMFEVSLGALENGMEQVGIQPPPNEDIAFGLAQVRSHWMSVQHYLAAVDAGESLSDEQRATVFLGLNKTMAQMNTVVGQYSAASKMNF